MNFALIGFVTFALVTLYRTQDISKRLRLGVEGWLARRGWQETPTMFAPRPWRWGFRFTWQVLSCPFCLGVYVAFGATWYMLTDGPTHRAFWLTWWGAWGIHAVLAKLWVLLDEVIQHYKALNAWAESQPPDQPTT